jgi:hypothetical protein
VEPAPAGLPGGGASRVGDDEEELDLAQWLARRESRERPAAARGPRRAAAATRRALARGRGAARTAWRGSRAGAAALVAIAAADLREQGAALAAIASAVAVALHRTAGALAGGLRALAAAAAGTPARARRTVAARAAGAAAALARVERARAHAGALAVAAGALLAVSLLAPHGEARDARGAGRPAPALSAAAPVRVYVNARPWALIRVDGVDVGPTPLSHVRLAPGPHAFDAAFPDGRRLQRVVEIGDRHRFVSFP